jgi:predicted amidohydrolase
MFGMPLDQVIACATVNAARAFAAFNDRGTLDVGPPKQKDKVTSSPLRVLTRRAIQ